MELIILIYKRCSRCNSRIQTGTECECKTKRYKEYDKDKTDIYTNFYKSGSWRKVREKAISYYNGIDIYSYYIDGIIERGQTVHHIQTLREVWNKRLDLSNLIYLTESNHRKLHNRMDGGEKDMVIDELYKLIERFDIDMKK